MFMSLYSLTQSFFQNGVVKSFGSMTNVKGTQGYNWSSIIISGQNRNILKNVLGVIE